MKKALVAFVCVAVMVLAIAVYFLEPQVSYWQATNYRFERQNGNWVTHDLATNSTSNGVFTDIYCQNRGAFNCKFTLVVQLTGATFIQNGSNPQISPQKAVLPVNLLGGQTHGTRLYFSIDQNVTTFFISIGVKPNQLFMRSSNHMWDGQNPLPYFDSNYGFEPNAY